MLVRIKCLTDEFAYYTQNATYDVMFLDASELHPRAFVFDNNGVLRKTNYINDSNTAQWDIVSIERNGCITVYSL